MHCFSVNDNRVTLHNIYDQGFSHVGLGFFNVKINIIFFLTIGSVSKTEEPNCSPVKQFLILSVRTFKILENRRRMLSLAVHKRRGKLLVFSPYQ